LKVKALARTYVQHAQGKTVSVNFSKGHFTAEIVIDTDVQAPTQIFALLESSQVDSWYANGYEMNVVSVDGSVVKYSSTVSDNRILIKVEDPAANGKTLRVSITPK